MQSIPKWSLFQDDEAASISASQQDPSAFSGLYDRYVQPVYRYLYYRTGSASDAEDLTSQTFLSALEALPQYRHRGCFAAWLFRIARGKLIDFQRKERKQLPLDETYHAQVGDLLAQVGQAD